MTGRKVVGLLLVASIVLAFGASWGASPLALSGGTAKNILVGPSSLRAAEGFAFDPIVRSGKFIAGVFFCAAVGTNTKKVTITKCYLVLSTGATYLGPVKSGTSAVLSTKAVTNVPAVNITECMTVTALFNTGQSTTVHLASAPKGQPVLPCKLG